MSRPNETKPIARGGALLLIVALVALLLARDSGPEAPGPDAWTTPSGVEVTRVKPGAGRPAPATAEVSLEFEARLADGTVIDSSERRERPWTFRLDDPGLIPGLRAGLEGIRPGEERIIAVPSELAYGETGRPPIPPGADLVFRVRLVEWESLR